MGDMAKQGAIPSGKSAELAAAKSEALTGADEAIQAAENTVKGLRKDVTAANQELAKTMRRSNELKERQVFYDTASLEDIGKRAAADLLSDMYAGHITHDQYESSIRTLQAAEKNLGKTQAYRNIFKKVAKGVAALAAAVVTATYFHAPVWALIVSGIVLIAAYDVFDKVITKLGHIKSELESINRKLNNLK